MSFVVNGQSYRVEKNGLTVLQACSTVGIEIPRFCYHEKLSIAGNCRMCLVEIAFPKTMKPVASCALPLSNNMVIYTNTMLVHKAREGVMEFLLANHPLDCPICDQGGECDLQDQSKLFGSDRGRFYEPKRAVEDKNWGPFIKTVMTRCIQCTRCVRYAAEIAGVPSVGTVGRGNAMEIGMYVEKILNSELSGNVIDICPVGALTSKPYSFTARPWELESFETIDVFDSFGARIKVDVRGREVMRIQPSLKEEINEEWITDKVRFCYDGLKLQRILQPMVKKSNFFLNCNWSDAVDLIANVFSKKYSRCDWGRLELIKAVKFNFAVFHGSLVDLNTIMMVKNFLDKIVYFRAHQPKPKHKTIFLYQRPFFFNSDFFENFVLGASYKNFSLNIDFLFLINVNLRLESPLFNLKIKKLSQKNKMIICSTGHITNLTFETLGFGNDLRSFVDVLKGKHLVCKKIIKSRHPILLFGEKFFFNKSGYEVFYYFSNFFKQIFNCLTAPKLVFHILPSSTGLLNNMIIGTSRKLKSIKFFQKRMAQRFFCLFLNTDDIHENFKFLKQDFIVYLGHNGDNSLSNVDLILPIPNYLERKSNYINMEGRIQTTQYIMEPPVLAAEEWTIFLSLFAYVFLPSMHFYEDMERFYFLYGDYDEVGYIRANSLFMSYIFLQNYLRPIKDLFIQQKINQPYFKGIFFASSDYKKKYQGFYKNIDFTGPLDNLKKVSLNEKNCVLFSNSKNFFHTDPITKASSILASATLKFKEINFVS